MKWTCEVIARASQAVERYRDYFTFSLTHASGQSIWYSHCTSKGKWIDCVSSFRFRALFFISIHISLLFFSDYHSQHSRADKLLLLCIRCPKVNQNIDENISWASSIVFVTECCCLCFPFIFDSSNNKFCRAISATRWMCFDWIIRLCLTAVRP